MSEENNTLPEGWVWTTLGNVAAINPKLDISALPDSTLVSFVPMAAVEAETGHIDTSTQRRLDEVSADLRHSMKEMSYSRRLHRAWRMASLPLLALSHLVLGTDLQNFMSYDHC